MNGNTSLAADAVPTAATAEPQLPRFACVICQQRKVKCNRLSPCSNCLKANASCVYTTPKPPKRRRKANEAMDLLEKLRRYEAAFKNLTTEKGVENEDSATTTGGRESDAPSEEGMKSKGVHIAPANETDGHGRLVIDRTKTKYFDSYTWADFADYYITARNARDKSQASPLSIVEYDDSSSPASFSLQRLASGLLLSHDFSGEGATMTLPAAEQLQYMWSRYLENVDPVAKIIHGPTVQKIVDEYAANQTNLSTEIEALLFCLCAVTIASLTNTDCEKGLNASRKELLKLYRVCAVRALTRTSFIKTTDVTVLQAYVLFLSCIRQECDPDTFWSLTGVGLRIAQRMGLHREFSLQQVSTLEAETRRRLWWYIIWMDSLSANICGLNPVFEALNYDVRLPLNVNDADLLPDMKAPPEERQGFTQMTTCLIRYNVGHSFREWRSRDLTRRSWNTFFDKSVPLEEKEAAANKLERLFEDKFLRYIDPLEPMHSLCCIIARTIVCKFRLVFHHPRQYPDISAIPPAERDFQFQTSLKIIEYYNLGMNIPHIHGFMWQILDNFQWDAFVVLLNELKYRTHGVEADKAWEQVDKAFGNYFMILHDSQRPLHVAVITLALAAWQVRARAVGYYLEEPQFITTLKAVGFDPFPGTTDDDAIVERDTSVTGGSTTQMPSLGSSRATEAHGRGDESSIGSTVLSTASGLEEEVNGVQHGAGVQDVVADILESLDYDSIDWGMWDSLLNNPTGSADGSGNRC
ncbi:fungal-specific transcription factor domain-containing protein [Limtongia smithiae]|uniref:fungal-specific transcription factor domain-containing protein n=1 Tax=Limtongia smithiae TaxID=1125753 RepID=UPI0034CEB065